MPERVPHMPEQALQQVLRERPAQQQVLRERPVPGMQAAEADMQAAEAGMPEQVPHMPERALQQVLREQQALLQESHMPEQPEQRVQLQELQVQAHYRVLRVKLREPQMQEDSLRALLQVQALPADPCKQDRGVTEPHCHRSNPCHPLQSSCCSHS